MATGQPNLSESLEDYLEVILDLEKTNKVARAKDIAEKLGVQRGSVTSSLKSLKEKGLLEQERYGYITLTPAGAKIARGITRRHGIIKDFLLRVLQLDPEEAEQVACRMEHALVKEETVKRFVNFIDFLDHCPRTGADWIQNFHSFCVVPSPTTYSEQCADCLDKCRSRFQDKGRDE